jgi:DNA repair ATPase RecN
MKPYDPKLNPNKSLEETIENFIAWIRTSNRGTASVLKNVSDKLMDISNTEEDLKTLQTSQIEAMTQINKLLTKVTNLSNMDQGQSEPTDFQNDLQNSLVQINN